MRDFHYTAIREQKWDSEILGLIAAIYKEAGKQEMYLKQRPEELEKLVEIAKALSKNVKLLILDEPLHGLDTYNRRRVKKIIEAFCHRKDKTMIMVTHYESELPGTITDRIFLKRNR